MTPKNKPERQLHEEIAALRSRVAELEQRETNWKTTEIRLRNSEERFRELFSNIPVGIAVYEAVDDGADFVFKDFNPAGARIEGVQRENVIGTRVTETFPGVEEMGLLDVFRRVWKTGRTERRPVSLYKDEKLTGWRENTVYKLPTGEIVAIYTDETQRKQIEQALRQSHNRYRRILESIGIAAFWSP